MSGPLVAAIDVGKTNAKIAFIDTRSGAEVWSEKRVNQVVVTPLGRQLDIEGIERWLVQTLQRAPDKNHVSAVVPVAHGAAAVLLDEQDAVVAAPDYEDPQFGMADASYDGERDAFERTFSPRLPLGLNLARQLFVLEREHPAAFARVAHILPYPQYWAWRLSGIMASEVTSLGCHTDLWLPREQSFSKLARAHAWNGLFPSVRSAAETLGPLAQEMSERTGLARECRVVCGIHDSNACWLEHSMERPRGTPFAVISSGTWTIAMASGADPARLRADRDMLANVDAFGAIVCTARFMGGREYDFIAGTSVAPDEAALASIIERNVMALPAFASGGPFAASAGKRMCHGQPLGAGDLNAHESAALATLYIALMTEVLLENLDARGEVIVDGPLATNPLFASLLSALRPSSEVRASRAVTSGARATCYLAGLTPPHTRPPRAVPPLRLRGLEAYRAEWRQRIPEQP